MDKLRKPTQGVDAGRRRLMTGLSVLGGFVAGSARAADSPHSTTRFPGDPAEHHVVYQLNKPDSHYHDNIIFSIGAMLRQYGDNIKIAVVAFGPGIHVLLKKPRRPVTTTVREKIASLNEYGVDFYACGNTLTSLKLGDADVVPFAKVVEVGASQLMLLQQQGYAYLSW